MILFACPERVNGLLTMSWMLEPPAWLLTIAAVLIWCAVVLYYLFVAHPPHRW